MSVAAPAPPSLRVLLALALPMVLARSTQSVIGFCDALMVAPLGSDALAATTTGALNTFAAIILPMGTAFILQSFAAQLLGRGELGAVRRYAWYGIFLAAGSAVVAAALIPLLGRLLALFHHAPAVHAAMTDYVSIRFLSVGAVVGTEALGNWYGGLGNTWMQLCAGVVAMVVNVLLCWLLIEGHWGAPALGVAGSAWAATVASWIGFAVVAVPFARGWGGAPRAAGRLGLRWSEMARVIRFGLPNGVNWFLEFSAFLVFINSIVGHLGTQTLAAMNVVFQINSVSFMPAFGMASAGAILAGQTIGRGRLDDVWPVVKLTLRATMSWQAAMGVVYVAIPATLIGLFVADVHTGKVLVEAGTAMLAISGAWQLFDAIALTFSEALRAAGDTAWCAWARILLAWAIFTPAAWLWVVDLGGGAVEAAICMVVYLALLAGLLVWRFRRNAWRSIDLTGIEPHLV